MGIFRGLGVVNDGLVFGYDTGHPISDNTTNNRFNQGQPATNNTIAANYSWYGDGSNQSFANKGVVEVTDESLKYNGYDTYLWTPGSSLNCYLNGSPELNYSDNSTVWTFSCYIKREDGVAITSLNVYMYYPGSDGSASGTIVDCGNGWYRVSRTRTGSSSQIQLAGFTGFVAGNKYYLSGVMLTKTNHTVPHVEIQSSRSDTASLIDLKRTLSIDVGDVSFDSTGQPTFDGTNDYIDIPSTNLISGTQDFTVESVYNLQGQTGGEIFGNYGSGYTTNHLWFSGQYGIWLDGGVYAPGAPLSNGKYHMVGLRQNGIMKLYLNGELVNSQTRTSSIATDINYRIGADVNGAGEPFVGDIYLVKAYNRALTAAEIKQNYHAYKNRFNI